MLNKLTNTVKATFTTVLGLTFLAYVTYTIYMINIVANNL